MTNITTPEQLAQRFHDTYERLAPSFGYETRKESKVEWTNVPENNRQLMIAVATEVLKMMQGHELEELRQVLLQLSALGEQKDSFRAYIEGSSEDTRKEFDTLRKHIEDATPGWELQKMHNDWADAWVLLPVKDQGAKS